MFHYISDYSRCTSTGRTCDGYERLEDYQYRIVRYALNSSTNPKVAVSTLSGFGDNVYYLEFYHHCVGPMLSGRFDMDFWSGTVLRMAHSEPAVRNAMITLAHLNKSQRGSLAATSTAHQSAQFWTYYNKAVRALIDRMNESSYTPEVGLVTCILFACVEFLRVDTQNAIIHMKNGLKIVAELREIHGMKAATRRADARKSGMSGPLAMIEKTLVPIFTQGLICSSVRC